MLSPTIPISWNFLRGHTTVKLTPNLELLYLFLLFLTAPAECSSYAKLSDANRASGAHRGNTLKCDRNDLAVGWYRFTDAAGTRMPTSEVPQHHCGTHAPGWMVGEHPKKEDGVVKRKVCFHWSSSFCHWSIYIDVRNCGAFYVYKLPKTPGCWFRYCGNKGHSKYQIQLLDNLTLLNLCGDIHYCLCTVLASPKLAFKQV